MTNQLPLSGSVADVLSEQVARLKHDLGKYIAFQSRWLAEESDVAELRAALIADLCETHRGPDGSRSAVEIWDAQRTALEPILREAFGVDDPDWRAIATGLSDIGQALPHLETADAAALGETRRVAISVSDAIARLNRRVRNLTS